MSACKTFSHQQVHQLLDEVLGPGLHAKRIASLADATLGVMHTASLAVCTIGHGLAMARGLNARHAVKQVEAFQAVGVALPPNIRDTAPASVAV